MSTRRIRLTSHLMTSQPRRRPFFFFFLNEETRRAKVKKERRRLWMRANFLPNLCGHQRTLWYPSDPSYKTENKRMDAPLQVAEAFGCRGRMDPR